jgi:intracellular sulfur oxidation DsrE/DsrF family protein
MWLILIALLLGQSLSAKMTYADPKPTFDHPRRVIMRLNSADVHAANHLIGTINNVLKEYPDGALNVAVIAYGPGMRVLRRDYDAQTLKRIRSLMMYDVVFVGCINTMKTMGWKRAEFLDGLEFVQAGVAEAIERQAAGWIDATPY